MERVVGRSELRSSDATPAPSTPDSDLLERLQIMQDFEVAPPSQAYGKSGAETERIEEVEEELDFRLFASSKAADSAPVGTSWKIRLRSPSLDAENAGFINPQRDPTYYFAATDHERSKEVAVSGQAVFAGSKSYWPGAAYPWKVLHLPPSGEHKSIRVKMPFVFDRLVNDEGRASSKRRRKGKKARIKLRTRRAAADAKHLSLQRETEEQEIAERAKRAKRNRDKKLKKRARDKVKKADLQQNTETASLYSEGEGAG